MEMPLPERRGSGAFKWDLAGDDEIPLWVADMDFPVAPAITNALAQRLKHPIFGYSSVPEQYPAAFRRWQAARNDWDIEAEHLVVLPSVMQGLAVAVEAFTAPGDRIGLFSPVYYPFFDVVEELGRVVVRMPLRIEETSSAPGARYTFDFDLIREQIKTVSAVLLCSPHNPGGRVWSRAELVELQEITTSAGVRVLSDEIHADLLFPGTAFVPWLRSDAPAPAGSRDSADIAFLAPSKTFNIPGLPTAWAVVPDPETRQTLKNALHARMHKLSNLLTMEAALAAYSGGGEWLEEIRSVLYKRYTTVREAIAPLDGVRVFEMEGTFIAWIDLRERWGLPRRTRFAAATGRDHNGTPRSRAFGTLARRHGVWLSDGSQFGPEGDGFMRLNFATSAERLNEGLQRLSAAIDAFDRHDA
ncbi:MAG: PatB family C-S lyase [Spirochaeta sp.]|nr:PatB family C-S lyase [Spirochaeta sp.]